MNPDSKRFLVIPDTHQHIDWVKKILEKESTNVDAVIFLGDYFDKKVRHAASAIETAEYFSKLKSDSPLEMSFLVGNHDLPYLFDIQRKNVFPSPSRNPYKNSVYDPSLSGPLAEALSADFLTSLQPFCFAGNWLLSHAGLHSSFLPANRDGVSSIEELHREAKWELDRLSDDIFQPLAGVGFARGGSEPNGSLTWLDWYKEFQDNLPWPQIVGHTILPSPENNGRSWNLDTRSGHYAVLYNDSIEVKSESK